VPRENLNDLQVFLAVARERSFTKAAAKMGNSQSALSHTIRHLEARLGVRLLTRTTRAVSPTETGEGLLNGIGPLFDEIDTHIDALSELRDKPAGNIRIAASDHAIKYFLWPKLRTILRRYPDIKVELVQDDGLTDIVTERFDAGVRMGEQVAKDMISVRMTPDFRFAAVGAKSYFKNNSEPLHPRDLVRHKCINHRLPTFGGFWVWEFQEAGGPEIKIRTDGQVAFNNVFNIIEAAVDGYGIAYLPEEIALPYITKGRLIRVLEQWSPYWDGYYLYYPSRRHSSQAFLTLIEALRHRE